MPKVFIREVVLSWASERRRHHNGGAQEVYTNSTTPGTVSPGNQYAVQPPGTTIGWTEGTTPRTGTFAYMTVGGGTEGTVLYSAQDSANGKTIPLIPVGENDIHIVMIYLPVGTGGTANPTVYVDAFNATTGQFVDNDFVSVTVDGAPNQVLTASVNRDGIIPTRNINNEHVLAFSSIEGQHFVKWQALSGTEPTNEEDLGINRDTTAFYLAVYENPTPIRIGKPSDQYSIWRWVDKGTMVDGGPHPWDPMIVEWATGIAMAANAKYANPKLQKQILEIASKQVLMAGETISKTIMSSTKEIDDKKKVIGM